MEQMKKQLAAAQRRADEAEAQLTDYRHEMERWDESVEMLLGPNNAVRFDVTKGDREALQLRKREFYRVILTLEPEQKDQLKRHLVMQIAIGDDAPELDWRYAVPADLFRRGLSEFQMVHISQQIGAFFYKRLKDEVSRNARQQEG